MPEALLLPARGQVPDLAACVRQGAPWRHENGGDQQMLAASPQVYLLCLSISPSRARCEGLRLAPPFSPAMRGLWFGEPPRPEPLALGHTLQPDVCSTVSHDPVMNVHVREDRRLVGGSLVENRHHSLRSFPVRPVPLALHDHDHSAFGMEPLGNRTVADVSTQDNDTKSGGDGLASLGQRVCH